MFEDITDRMRNAFSIFASEPIRLGAVAVGALIVMGVIVGSIYGSSYIATHFNSSISLPTNTYCTQSYYLFPMFTNGLNFFLTQTEVECLGISSPLVPTLLAWYLQFLAIIFIGVFIAIVIFDLQG